MRVTYAWCTGAWGDAVVLIDYEADYRAATKLVDGAKAKGVDAGLAPVWEHVPAPVRDGWMADTGCDGLEGVELADMEMLAAIVGMAD